MLYQIPEWVHWLSVGRRTNLRAIEDMVGAATSILVLILR